jgi:putative photosynthetic complex assembly protein
MSGTTSQGYLSEPGSHPMRGHLPKWPALALIAIIGLTLVQALTARVTGAGASRVPDGVVERVLPLRFFDEPDGAIRIMRATDDRQIDLIAPTTHAFTRITMRGLVRERRKAGGNAEIPFLLQDRTDGRLILEDPVTGRRLLLNSFGTPNLQAFRRLFAASDEVK